MRTRASAIHMLAELSNTEFTPARKSITSVATGPLTRSRQRYYLRERLPERQRYYLRKRLPKLRRRLPGIPKLMCRTAVYGKAIKGKWDRLKRAYIDFAFILKQTGFSWDDDRHTVVASEEAWSNLLKVDNMCNIMVKYLLENVYFMTGEPKARRGQGCIAAEKCAV
ncbi:hypothetical protein CJ030_MR8G006228 [Morella rubra]|uniref:Myb/SANT-like domain-containing protein n=1 Tax=Morella rubra TaxID=262757 RepID=A0A6A1URP8_9ROSI|nr:hypothetical protein CJ030_MR8G006228 [Morella rubra]